MGAESGEVESGGEGAGLEMTLGTFGGGGGFWFLGKEGGEGRGGKIGVEGEKGKAKEKGERRGE